MPKGKIGTIILAAGRSTRMKSAIPKVLHPVCGRPLVTHTVSSAISASFHPIVVVTSLEFKKQFEDIFKSYKNTSLAIQKRQLGTGDAVKAAQKAIGTRCDYVLIIPGDVPLIKSETLKKFIESTISNEAVCGVMTMELQDPAQYGRIIRDGYCNVKAIVEAHDANPEELMVKEVNSGIYCVKSPWVFKALSQIRPTNSQKEYYLTDIVKIAVAEGLAVSAWCVQDPSEPMGVNTRKELSEANRIMRYRILDKLMADGVGIQDDLHTYIDEDVKIGIDTTIAPHCFISGKIKIGKGCRIDNGVVISNSTIGDNVHIKPYSVIEDSIIKDEAQIGPFAHLRPMAIIDKKAKIGNFVEVKKSHIKAGAKANHLSYIGDAVIGKRTNVGCGTITCNYDGKLKHKTIVGDDVFIGSDVQFVAPVRIGSKSTIGAGSTVTDNVPPNSLAIARGRQVVKRDYRK